MQDEINDLRKRINGLDEQILRSLNERAELAMRIGRAKAKTGAEVYDPARERAVLERMDTLNPGPLDKGAIEEVFAGIITACRELQMR